MIIIVPLIRTAYIGEVKPQKVVYVEDEEEMDEVYEQITSGFDEELDYDFEPSEAIQIEETVKAALYVESIEAWNESSTKGCINVTYEGKELLLSIEFEDFTNFIEEVTENEVRRFKGPDTEPRAE
jgi:hypothetical protein